MYDKILLEMANAARGGRVRFRSHALDEMSNDDLSPDDVINCILTGEIVEDQFDPCYQQMKFVIWGDSHDGAEMGVVARLDDYDNLIVITVFRMIVIDYE